MQRQKSKKQQPDQQQQARQGLADQQSNDDQPNAQQPNDQQPNDHQPNDQQPNDQQLTQQAVVEQQHRAHSQEAPEVEKLQALHCDLLQTQAAEPQQAGLLLQAQPHSQTETKQLQQQQACEQQSSPASALTVDDEDEPRHGVQSDDASSDALALTVPQRFDDDSEHAHTQSQATVHSSNDLFLQDLFCCPLTKVTLAVLIPVSLVLTSFHMWGEACCVQMACDAAKLCLTLGCSSICTSHPLAALT